MLEIAEYLTGGLPRDADHHCKRFLRDVRKWRRTGGNARVHVDI